jgi:hypothetical protein
MVVIAPVVIHVFVAGSYSSASVELLPPVTKIFPLVRNVAVWPARAWPIAPVGIQVPVVGSYNSALSREPLSDPPATNTVPLGSNVAV